MEHNQHNPTDAELVAQVLAGNRGAFGPLLSRHYASVERLCRRLLPASFETQDVAQDAALTAFLSLERLHEPERFGAWLHAIAANLARMALRRRRPLSLEALEGSVVLWSAQPAPEAVAAMRETHDAIVAAINELSALNREAVVGFYLEGYSYSELATLLGVPVTTLKGRLFFGRRQLRSVLRPLANETLQRKELVMTTTNFILVTINSVRIEEAVHQHRVVVLRERDGERILPIWVGVWEGDAIRAALEGQQSLRPLTHDLTLRLLETLGAQVEQVLVNKIEDQTFYAEITLTHNGQQQRIDARPSDAIALAARAAIPILIAQPVLDQHGGPDDEAFWERLRERARQYEMEQKHIDEKKPQET